MVLETFELTNNISLIRIQRWLQRATVAVNYLAYSALNPLVLGLRVGLRIQHVHEIAKYIEVHSKG